MNAFISLFFSSPKQRELSALQPTQAFDEGDGAGGEGGEVGGGIREEWKIRRRRRRGDARGGVGS